VISITVVTPARSDNENVMKHRRNTMDRIHPRSTGFVLALFLGSFHALWACLVWAGAAQWLLDFVFRLHMITPPYQVTAFNAFTATGLVLMTAAVGYVAGWLINVVWNHIPLRPSASWQVEHHEPTHAH
jgi:hypothetical protein